MHILFLLILVTGCAWIMLPLIRTLKEKGHRQTWVMVIGCIIAVLFLLKGNAVMSVLTAVAALFAKMAYSPIFRVALRYLLPFLPGLAGARARKTKQEDKQYLRRKEAADLLDVAMNASHDEIKQAYHTYMKQHHPDKPEGSEQAAKRGAEARDILLESDASE